jgi:hypothetical protein
MKHLPLLTDNYPTHFPLNSTYKSTSTDPKLSELKSINYSDDSNQHVRMASTKIFWSNIPSYFLCDSLGFCKCASNICLDNSPSAISRKYFIGDRLRYRGRFNFFSRKFTIYSTNGAISKYFVRELLCRAIIQWWFSYIYCALYCVYLNSSSCLWSFKSEGHCRFSLRLTFNGLLYSVT